MAAHTVATAAPTNDVTCDGRERLDIRELLASLTNRVEPIANAGFEMWPRMGAAIKRAAITVPAGFMVKRHRAMHSR
jgi:hypothetical protein